MPWCVSHTVLMCVRMYTCTVLEGVFLLPPSLPPSLFIPPSLPIHPSLVPLLLPTVIAPQDNEEGVGSMVHGYLKQIEELK